MSARPITIRGETFSSIKAAADHFGVCRGSLHRAIKRGTLDHVGFGTGYRPRMPISVRGVTYPDAEAAAAALGVTRGAVWSALERNSLDRLGLGVDYARRKGGTGPKKPIVVANQSFASIADLARFIGRKPANVADSLRKYGDGARGRIILAVMDRLNQEEQAKRQARLKAKKDEERKAA